LSGSLRGLMPEIARLAWRSKSLANHSKTWQRDRAYKVAYESSRATAPSSGIPAVCAHPALRTHSMPNKLKVVAVIDDNLDILRVMSRALSAFGYDSELYVSAKEFLDAATTTEAICLIVDVQLGKSCGFELAQQLAAAGFIFPIIFMSGHNTECVKRRAAATGGVAFLSKPFSPEDLVQALMKLPTPRAL
jgi:CheY-like chemotaxis protein